MSRNARSYEFLKALKNTIFRYGLAKITNTKFTRFSCGLAKIVEFKILTIFRYSSLRIFKIFALCYLSYNKSAKRRYGFYKICEYCGFYKFNPCDFFKLLGFLLFLKAL